MTGAGQLGSAPLAEQRDPTRGLGGRNRPRTGRSARELVRANSFEEALRSMWDRGRSEVEPERRADRGADAEARTQTAGAQSPTDREGVTPVQDEGRHGTETPETRNEETDDRVAPVAPEDVSDDDPQVAAAAAQALIPVALAEAAREGAAKTDEGLTPQGEGAAKGNGGNVTPWLRFLEGGQHSGTSDHSEGEKGSNTASLPRPPEGGSANPVLPAGGNALDLLEVHEVMDPNLRIETAPTQVLGRLQQAMSADPTVTHMEELGEVVLPQVIRGLATLVRNDMAEMRIQLQPPDLGEIELRVRALEGMVRGDITVQNQEIKYLLESQIERLRAALEQHGLELEGLDVEVSPHGRFARQDLWGQGGDRTQGNGSTGGGAASRAEGETAGDTRQSPSPPGDSEIDYLA